MDVLQTVAQHNDVEHKELFVVQAPKHYKLAAEETEHEKNNATEPAPPTDSFIKRIERIRNSQQEYSVLFGKLNTIIGQLKEKYPVYDEHNENEEATNCSDGTEHFSRASSTTSEQEPTTHNKLKRKSSDLSEPSDFIEVGASSSSSPPPPSLALSQQYPRRHANETTTTVIIGPNGTELEADAFDGIVWGTTAAATRSLLALVFSSDVLATHTLTGKPSPAFYGRERPLKMQLDPLKTADIVHCVRVKCQSSEREVRSSITTKCADTAKKYKRRLEKKLKRQ